MAETISFDLVSPERLLLSTHADMVTVPGTDGYMGVMAGHMSLISTLRPGVIDVLKDGKDTKYFIRGGFAEVNSEKITVLAEEAIPMAELAVEIIDQRIRDAEEDLAAAKTDAERHKAAETLDDLRLVRAAF
jgi:F-type H+-transporting ATPase subunit epsilon